MPATTYTAAEIANALAAGRTVTAEASDLERKGQPRRGARVTVTALIGDYGERVSVHAAGYRGAFKARAVEIDGVPAGADAD